MHLNRIKVDLFPQKNNFCFLADDKKNILHINLFQPHRHLCDLFNILITNKYIYIYLYISVKIFFSIDVTWGHIELAQSATPAIYLT